MEEYDLNIQTVPTLQTVIQSTTQQSIEYSQKTSQSIQSTMLTGGACCPSPGGDGHADGPRPAHAGGSTPRPGGAPPATAGAEFLLKLGSNALDASETP